MGSPFRAAIRLVVYLGWTALLMPAQILGVACRLPLAVRLPLFYHRCCRRILGLDVQVRGEMSPTRPTLFVSNHSSYVDISVLASVIRGSFIAKAEIARWPFFGLLARLQRTVFIDRRGGRAATHRDDMLRRLRGGENLILFPEGTSADGNRVLPFKSALFSVAQYEIDGLPLVVQPVSVAYTHLDGMPVGRTLRPYIAWYGDMGLVSHIWTLLGLGAVTARVTFHAPVRLPEHGSRKALAEHCFDVVARGVAEANAGLGERGRKRRRAR